MLLAVDVATVFADGREDDLGHPVLEVLGLPFLGTHDKLVEAAFRHSSERRLAEGEETLDSTPR